MASAKNSRSNKTAHVLNLLTEPGEAAKDTSRTERAERPERTPAAPVPDNSEEVASAIRDALEEDLLAELAEEEAPVNGVAAAPPKEAADDPGLPETAPEPQPEPNPIEKSTPAPEAPEPEPETEAETEPETEPAPVPAEELAVEAQPEPASEPHPEESGHEENLMEDITYMNVMQALVEDRVDKYMKTFKMCTCHRCRTDVVALALTSLPAKYIVIPGHESVPMLSIYESRYSAEVTAQIVSACQKVSEHPRHANENDGRLRLGAPRNDE